MIFGKQLRLFLPKGSSVGVCYAEVVNWTGQAFRCSWNELSELARFAEARRPGVYMLKGVNFDTGQPAVYIGESEDVYDRLTQHARNPKLDIEVVWCFTSKDSNLTKGHIKFLEKHMQDRLEEVGGITLVKGQSAGGQTLSRAEVETMLEFLDLLYLVAVELGFSYFTLTRKVKPSALFTYNTQMLKAEGFPCPEGFTVLAGSQASLLPNPSFKGSRVRDDLLHTGVLATRGNALLFIKSYIFTSASAAASLIAGGSVNGLTAWCDSAGKTLKDYQISRVRLTAPLLASHQEMQDKPSTP